MKAFTWGCVLVSILYNLQMQVKFYPSGIGNDFRLCYHEAKGEEWRPLTNYQDSKVIGHYLYHPWLKVLWIPATWLPEMAATWINYALSAFCLLALFERTMRIEYGWLVVLCLLRISLVLLASGNVAIILAYISLTTLGRWFSTAIKPHSAVVHILAHWKSTRQHRMDTDLRCRHSHLATADLDSYAPHIEGSSLDDSGDWDSDNAGNIPGTLGRDESYNGIDIQTSER